MVKRERDKKEKKLRKQLERQAKRLQLAKQKPGVNTMTLIEAIQQTFNDIRAVSIFVKNHDDLLPRELRLILSDALGTELCTEMLKKAYTLVRPNTPPKSTMRLLEESGSNPEALAFANFNVAAAAAAVAAAANLQTQNNKDFSPFTPQDRAQSDHKANPFSIDNLLSSRHVPGSFLSAAAAAVAAASMKNASCNPIDDEPLNSAGAADSDSSQCNSSPSKRTRRDSGDCSPRSDRSSC